MLPAPPPPNILLTVGLTQETLKPKAIVSTHSTHSEGVEERGLSAISS